jgi:hypothetical protein
LAVFAVGLARAAGAEDLFHWTQGVSCPPGGADCVQFQGYIYVRRGGDEAAPPTASAGGDENAPEARLGERRVYLHLGSAQWR